MPSHANNRRKRNAKPTNQSTHRRMLVESLESRQLMVGDTTFTVLNSLDSGPGSLRQAIINANASTTNALIQFAIPTTDAGFVDSDSTIAGGDAAADVFRIRPLTRLPNIRNASGNAVEIRGSSQTAFTGETNALGPEVVLDGSVVSIQDPNATALIASSMSTTIQGLVIGGFGYGIFVEANQAIIKGNYIGLDASGTIAQRNANDGVLVNTGITGVQIGGNTPASRNVISGNVGPGVSLNGSLGAIVSGNYIGTTASGMARLENGLGIRVLGSGHLIGGPTTAHRNILSGNRGNGILVDRNAFDITITSNYVGVNATGNAAIGNGTIGVDSHGIRLDGGGTNITIGAPGAGNVVSGNLSRGIGDLGAINVVIQSNFIGTDKTGSVAIPNKSDGIGFNSVQNILIGGELPSERNIISGNGGVGIGIQGDDIRILGNYIGTDVTGQFPIGNSQSGIYVVTSRNVQIGGAASNKRNLVSANNGDGIEIRNSDEVAIAGNYVGTNASGNSALGNTNGGITVPPESSNITIGGDTVAAGNLVSGNLGRSGIFSWGGFRHTIVNNRVGTDASGLAAIPNAGFGIEVQEGVLVNMRKNLVAHNGSHGIEVRDSRSLKSVQWTSSAGGNGSYFAETPNLYWDQSEALAVTYGGHLADIATEAENEFLKSTFATTGNRWIGLNDRSIENTFVWTSGLPYNASAFTKFNGAEPNGGSSENVVELLATGNWNDVSISNERRSAVLEFATASAVSTYLDSLRGILVGGVNASDGNTILANGRNGVSILGNTSNVAIQGNSISNNTLLGIDLAGNGVTPNDPGDADTGPNGLQNFPVLAFRGGTFTGTLNSIANKTYQIEVFKDAASGLAAAEGQTLIHKVSVTTDASGNATFSIPTASVPVSGQLTATATADDGSTSEFSAALAIGPIAEVSVDGTVLVDGTNLSLGAAAPGTVVERIAVVTNRGTAAVTLQPATTTGPFSIIGNLTAGQVLAPGASASLIVRSTTTVAGTHLGNLRLTSSDPNNPQLNFPLGLSLVTGLKLVKDINPGPAGSVARQLTNLNGKLVFQAIDSANGAELWTSDFTDSGTTLVKDIRVGSASSGPTGLVANGGNVFFSAFDSTTGRELWKSDGTTANTTQVLDINPGGASGLDFSNLFASSAGIVYFDAATATNGGELWRTDGTLAGTALLKDISVGSLNSNPGDFVEFNGKVYFGAGTTEFGRELWTTDGTAAGTILFKDLIPGASSSNPTPLGVANGRLFFSTFDSAGGDQLWITDGTSQGTVQIKQLDVLDFLGVIGNQAIFSAFDPVTGYELWRSDGTTLGTSQIRDIRPGVGDGVGVIGASAVFNNQVYFYANDGITGTEVWVTDGTSAGTKPVLDLNPLGSSNGSILPLQIVNGQLAIGGDDGRVGHELWTLDIRLPDTTKPTSRVNALPARASSTSFTVSVTGSDPLATGSTQVVSGVKEYDLFVATGSGAFVKFATVPVANPTTTFIGQSNKTYFFRSLARDNAGNLEAKTLGSEATTYVPDLDRPVTSVTNVSSSTADFVITMQGTDAGGSGLASFAVFVSLDNAAPVLIGNLVAGTANVAGTYTKSLNYRAISDGSSHSYRFFTNGRDGIGNVEFSPASGDLTIVATFAAPSNLVATALDVQRGALQRSYIRNVDVQFNSPAGLQSLLDTVTDGDTTNDRLTLKRFAKDGTGVGQAIPLTAGILTRNGSKLAFDFGAGGIGGNANSTVGDGYYEIGIDTDGNGTVDQRLHFYRLLGDTNGDRKVDNEDVKNVAAAIRQPGINPDADINGDGKVDAMDRYFASFQRNNFIVAGLPLDD